MAIEVDARAAGFEAKKLARIGEHLSERYVEPGKIAGCQVLVSRHGKLKPSLIMLLTKPISSRRQNNHWGLLSVPVALLAQLVRSAGMERLEPLVSNLLFAPECNYTSPQDVLKPGLSQQEGSGIFFRVYV